MNEVKNHYDNLLGSVYSWILGDFKTAYKQNIELLRSLDIPITGNGIAIDLGAGPGSQSIPLAELGFEVIAIDFCDILLDELQKNAGDLKIKTICADITKFKDHINRQVELIVCMGDTLVHLSKKDDAEKILIDAVSTLISGGSIIISIRDYHSPGPTGSNRFIPIRSSENQIFTCFLEYEDEIVRVSDILQTKKDNEWNFNVSSYNKLRLKKDWVSNVLVLNSMNIVNDFERDGMLFLHAKKL